MRKIISRHEEEKKKKRTQFIVGGILISIMVLSLLGYAFQGQSTDESSSNSTLDYNGISFTNQNGFWAVNYGNQRIVFTYHPSQILSADLTNMTKSIDNFSGESLYISSYNSFAESEIRMDLLPFASEIKGACLQGENCSDSQIPVKNCGDNFIIIQNGSANVMQEQNCIFISGQGEDLIKLVDNILFKIFGIRE